MGAQLDLPNSAPFPNLLCKYCKKIEFSMYNQLENKKYRMPSKQEMKANTSCPFCRLVIEADLLGTRMFNMRDDRDDQKIIYAEWIKDRGFKVSEEWNYYTVVFHGTDGFESKSAHGMGRYVQHTIHPALVNKWMRLCESHHGRECMPTPNVVATSEQRAGLKVFRMIDVFNQCIVEVGHGCRYVALSYMWGQVEAVKLLSQNKDQLMAHAGLLAFRYRLPRTINDSIELLRNIGEQYLWVDSICLLQDDAEEMADAIGKMHLVYQGAVLTILAGAGKDANAGLPGVHFGSRRLIQHFAEVQPGIQMTVVEPLSGILNQSAHITRGWTMQEHALSHRLLIFTPTRVFFQCRRNCWSEDTIYDDFPQEINNAVSVINGFQMPFIGESDPKPFTTWANVVLNYSGRELTWDSDTLKAAAGILNVQSSHFQCEMLAGMPTGVFDLAILFHHPWDYGNKGFRRKGYPSWSWAGWRRHTTFMKTDNSPGEINHWLQTQTYIVWYKRETRALQASLVWNVHEGLTDDITVYATQDSGTPYGRAGKTKFDLGLNETPISAVEVLHEYPLLQFWAYIVHFITLEHPSEGAWNNLERTERIRGRDGELCGGIRINDYELLEGVKSPYECVLLSKEASYENTFRERADNVFKEFNGKPIWWAMLIVWDGPVAERRGLGFIYDDCLQYMSPAGKVWKEILLA